MHGPGPEMERYCLLGGLTSAIDMPIWSEDLGAALRPAGGSTLAWIRICLPACAENLPRHLQLLSMPTYRPRRAALSFSRIAKAAKANVEYATLSASSLYTALYGLTPPYHSAAAPGRREQPFLRVGHLWPEHVPKLSPLSAAARAALPPSRPSSAGARSLVITPQRGGASSPSSE